MSNLKLGVLVLLGGCCIVFITSPRVRFLASAILEEPDQIKLKRYEYLSREWHDHSILENATGAVFAADAPWESIPENERGRLRRYDLARREWIPAGEATPRVTDFVLGAMASWDVHGGWLAYCTPIDEDNMDTLKAVICQVDTGDVVREFEGNYCQTRLSPSKTKIALIDHNISASWLNGFTRARASSSPAPAIAHSPSAQSGRPASSSAPVAQSAERIRMGSPIQRSSLCETYL